MIAIPISFHDFLPDIVPRLAIQESHRPSCMGFVRDRIANTLFYIYMCVCVLLGNFTIKPHTKSILTKHKKLFFFNHNFNRSFNQTHKNLKRTSQKTLFIKLLF